MVLHPSDVYVLVVVAWVVGLACGWAVAQAWHLRPLGRELSSRHDLIRAAREAELGLDRSQLTEDDAEWARSMGIEL